MCLCHPLLFIHFLHYHFKIFLILCPSPLCCVVVSFVAVYRSAFTLFHCCVHCCYSSTMFLFCQNGVDSCCCYCHLNGAIGIGIPAEHTTLTKYTVLAKNVRHRWELCSSPQHCVRYPIYPLLCRWYKGSIQVSHQHFEQWKQNRTFNTLPSEFVTWTTPKKPR